MRDSDLLSRTVDCKAPTMGGYQWRTGIWTIISHGRHVKTAKQEVVSENDDISKWRMDLGQEIRSRSFMSYRQVLEESAYSTVYMMGGNLL